MKTKFTQLGFVLAAAGSAVGLGNIWKFPYMTGENGGGAFVLIYLATILCVGLTIFIAEVSMGRLSEGDSVSAFESMATKFSKIWKYAGLMVFSGVLIVSFYLVVIGWIVKYIFEMAVNLPENVDVSAKIFGNFVANEALSQFVFFTLMFCIVFYIVSKGIKKGIEKTNLILMPMLILILIFMLFYAFSMDGFGKSVEFLFKPDWSKVTSKSIISAVGHAFFTLSLGLCCIMTYAASLPRDANIAKTSLQVAFLDTAIALVAGLVIFTFIFHFDAKPSQGPGLVFISLPTLFYQLGFIGKIFGVLFFVALAFAGITSAISMIEPTAFFLIRRFKLSRQRALVIIAIVVYVFGLLAMLSNIESSKEFATFFSKGFFDILDFLTSSILLPVGGIVIAIFLGFFTKKEALEILLKPYMGRFFNIWYFALRYVAPISVFVVLVNGLRG